MGQDSLRHELFSTSMPVLVNHLNYGNHLGYDSVLSLFQEARMRWLRQYNMTEVSLEGTIGYLVTHVSVDYLAEGLHGDMLRVSIRDDSASRRGLTLGYEIFNETSGKILAQGVTQHVFFDFAARKIASAPASFLALFESDDDVQAPPA